MPDSTTVVVYTRTGTPAEVHESDSALDAEAHRLGYERLVGVVQHPGDSEVLEHDAWGILRSQWPDHWASAVEDTHREDVLRLERQVEQMEADLRAAINGDDSGDWDGCLATVRAIDEVRAGLHRDVEAAQEALDEAGIQASVTVPVPLGVGTMRVGIAERIRELARQRQEARDALTNRVRELHAEIHRLKDSGSAGDLYVVTRGLPGPGADAIIAETEERYLTSMGGSNLHVGIAQRAFEAAREALRATPPCEFVELEDEEGASHGRDLGVGWGDHPETDGLCRLGPFRPAREPGLQEENEVLRRSGAEAGTVLQRVLREVGFDGKGTAGEIIAWVRARIAQLEHAAHTAEVESGHADLADVARAVGLSDEASGESIVEAVYRLAGRVDTLEGARVERAIRTSNEWGEALRVVSPQIVGYNPDKLPELVQAGAKRLAAHAAHMESAYADVAERNRVRGEALVAVVDALEPGPDREFDGIEDAARYLARWASNRIGELTERSETLAGEVERLALVLLPRPQYGESLLDAAVRIKSERDQLRGSQLPDLAHALRDAATERDVAQAALDKLERERAAHPPDTDRLLDDLTVELRRALELGPSLLLTSRERIVDGFREAARGVLEALPALPPDHPEPQCASCIEPAGASDSRLGTAWGALRQVIGKPGEVILERDYPHVERMEAAVRANDALLETVGMVVRAVRNSVGPVSATLDRAVERYEAVDAPA